MSHPAKRAVTFIHTSPVAIAPLTQFYGTQAPELEITNLLDDGIMRHFSSGEENSAKRRFEELISTAIVTYQAEVTMLTCSTISRKLMADLRKHSPIPLIKIDEQMARGAVSSARFIGVVVTFAPTVESARFLLLETAKELGKVIELKFEVLPAAYDALLNGNDSKHDQLLMDGVSRLAHEKVDAIVLAQVSMSRIQTLLDERLSIPIFSSLSTSLCCIRKLLEQCS